MKPFTYASPATVDEAIALLDGKGGDTVRLLAGGTDLITLIKGDITTPAQLINIKQLDGLSAAIEERADGVTIGALTPLSVIERHPVLKERYGALAEAAAVAATPQLRNMATIGGNLLQRPRCWYFRNELFHCWLKGGTECQARHGENQQHALFGDSPCVAVHPSDLAPALLALGAEVQLRGASGERTLPLEAFFALPTDERRRETVLGEDEIILSIRLPSPQAGTRSTYFKAMDRKVWAFALVGVAAALRVENGQIADARLVLSGVAPIPWRATAAEQELIGASPDAALFAKVAETALADAQPLEHNGYKVALLRGLIPQALEAVSQ